MTTKQRNRGAPRTSNAAANTSTTFFSAWYGKAWLLGVLGIAASLAVYLSRGTIADLYISVQNMVVSTLGLGLAPVVLWLAVFFWALSKRRSLFRHAKLWLGSAGLVALSLGIMDYFQPSQGALAWFTLGGQVSLGGHVGEAIVGHVAWLGVLRLLVVFIATVTVTSPPLAADIAMALGKLASNGYILLALAVRGIARMYRFDRVVSAQERVAASTAGADESSAPPEVLAPHTHAATVPGPGVDLYFTARHGEAPVDDSFDTEGELLPSEQSASGKFNRFWDSAQHEAGTSDPDARDQSWARPSTDLLLSAPEGGISETEMHETAETIRQTLAEYDVEVNSGQIRPGPVVTMYGLTPGWIRRYKQVKQQDEHGRPILDESGKPVVTREETKTRVKVDNILSREKDLALALKTPSIRIETPAMGKSLVGIEVPNPNPSLVTLRSVMESQEFARLRARAHLPLALGKGTGGETVVTDLVKMPHLLIAGATGSGKSVCLNAVISCLIMEKSPADMRLLLIDPKRVELTPYNGIPHLLTPVVVETDRVVALLKGLIREMLDRYRRMEEVGVRNIEAYNRKVPDRMPFLVVAIDELADLMMSAAFDVEQSLCRLAQLGRATGIHLIIATQRPSVDVVTGLIKANFPSRISFGVTSHIDSRTILDTVGAEKLLGRGDMLYVPLEASRPVRVQGVFISDREIQNLVNFWQATPRASLPRIPLHAVEGGGDDEAAHEMDADSQDELMEKAIVLAQSYNKLSTSLLQRRLRIGYPRAARLVDLLEEKGIVGPGDGSKSRDVIINKV